MAKVNYVAVLNFVAVLTQFVEALSTKATRKEKVEAAVDFSVVVIPALEQLVGKDLLNETAIKPLYDEAAIALVALLEVVEKAKDVPVRKPVVE